MTRITGQQARQLLDGTTEGPWEAGPGMDFMRCRVVFDRKPSTDIEGAEVSHVLADVGRPGDADLLAAAPDLAETIAWLYGRESDLEREHYTNWDPTDRADQWGVSAMKWKGNVLLGDNHSMQASELSPDEAVDLARALLAAAQEARREV